MHLDEHSHTPFYRQLEAQLREGIESGTYPTGSRLPSIRGLAADLGCARNTVEQAYHLLVQEGYVASRPGSGYVVQNVAYLQPDASAPSCAVLLGGLRQKARYDFTYGNLEPGTFPAIAWRLVTQRDIDCTPEQIVVQGGTQTSVQNLLTLFDAARDTVAMEDPGYDGVRSVIERARFAIKPCRVTDDVRVFLSDLESSGARLAYLTPSSQFPTCRIMPTDVRERVLAWAESADAYILEDDYCRDFRYRERSLAPLASMDGRGRVIYMGTFSKSLSPALRVNYLVLPTPLLKRWREAFASSYSPVPWLNQQVLARFMTDGSWDRHLRRVQTRNRRKYDALTAALREYMGDKVDVLECGTGLHLLVRVRDGRSQDELVAAAAAADVAVYPTKKYWANPACATKGVVLVGFSSIAEADIRPGIAALARAWFG